MAKPSDPLEDVPHPPRLGQFIIGWLAPPREREALLGDFCEEFADRVANGSAPANRWYWGQVIRSLPHLVVFRLRSVPIRKRLRTIAVIAGSVLLLVLWDLHVARGSAQYVAASADSPSLLTIRSTYFAVYALGGLASGALIAWVLFAGRRSFWANVTRYLGPVALVIIVLSLIASVERGIIRASTYLLLRNFLVLGSLLAGAAIQSNFRKRR